MSFTPVPLMYEEFIKNIEDDENVIGNEIPQFHNVQPCIYRIRNCALSPIPDNCGDINFEIP